MFGHQNEFLLASPSFASFLALKTSKISSQKKSSKDPNLPNRNRHVKNRSFAAMQKQPLPQGCKQFGVLEGHSCQISKISHGSCPTQLTGKTSVKLTTTKRRSVGPANASPFFQRLRDAQGEVKIPMLEDSSGKGVATKPSEEFWNSTF